MRAEQAQQSKPTNSTPTESLSSERRGELCSAMDEHLKPFLGKTWSPPLEVEFADMLSNFTEPSSKFGPRDLLKKVAKGLLVDSCLDQLAGTVPHSGEDENTYLRAVAVRTLCGSSKVFESHSGHRYRTKTTWTQRGPRMEVIPLPKITGGLHGKASTDSIESGAESRADGAAASAAKSRSRKTMLTSSAAARCLPLSLKGEHAFLLATAPPEVQAETAKYLLTVAYFMVHPAASLDAALDWLRTQRKDFLAKPSGIRSRHVRDALNRLGFSGAKAPAQVRGDAFDTTRAWSRYAPGSFLLDVVRAIGDAHTEQGAGSLESGYKVRELIAARLEEVRAQLRETGGDAGEPLDIGGTLTGGTLESTVKALNAVYANPRTLVTRFGDYLGKLSVLEPMSSPPGPRADFAPRAEAPVAPSIPKSASGLSDKEVQQLLQQYMERRGLAKITYVIGGSPEPEWLPRQLDLD
jgi:hypothetical protein